MSEKKILCNSFLKISNSPIFPKFLHDCCDEICQGKLIDKKNYNDDIEWTSEDINKAKTIIKDLFCKSIMDDKFMIDNLITGDILYSFNNCLEIRRNDIEYHLIKAAFLEAEHSLVEHIDWKLKWILGNSIMPAYKEPILQLKLGCSKKKGANLIHNIDFEMNIEQVDQMIKVLEGILEELSYDGAVIS